MNKEKKFFLNAKYAAAEIILSAPFRQSGQSVKRTDEYLKKIDVEEMENSRLKK